MAERLAEQLSVEAEEAAKQLETDTKAADAAAAKAKEEESKAAEATAALQSKQEEVVDIVNEATEGAGGGPPAPVVRSTELDKGCALTK